LVTTSLLVFAVRLVNSTDGHQDRRLQAAALGVPLAVHLAAVGLTTARASGSAECAR
jgi:hypothetical protein